MRISTIVFLLVLPTLTFTQTVFTVDDFAKEYYGKVQISDTSKVFSQGWVAMYDRKTNDSGFK